MTTKLKWLDLTEEERKWYGNGCGPKFGIFGIDLSKEIPEMTFSGACARHDFNYDKGGTEEDRTIADELFLKDMKESLFHTGSFEKLYLKMALRVYHFFVRTFGNIAFHYGDYLTKEELKKTHKEKYGREL